MNWHVPSLESRFMRNARGAMGNLNNNEHSARNLLSTCYLIAHCGFYHPMNLCYDIREDKNKPASSAIGSDVASDGSES